MLVVASPGVGSGRAISQNDSDGASAQAGACEGVGQVPMTGSRTRDASCAAETQAQDISTVVTHGSASPPLPPLPSTHPPPPPNGGYGWVCTACVSVINGHTWGLNSSYGVFLAHYLEEQTFPGATPLEYAFVGSLSISGALLVSPIATTCVRRFGTKPTMLAGVVVEAASLICASFASRIWHLFLTQGVMFGIGMGFLFIPSVAVVPQWFTTKRSLANGLAACGSGLGGLLYSLAAGAMIRTLGLAWAFRILGILAFVVNTACTLVIKDRNKIIGSSQLAFDTTLLKRLEFLLLLGFGWFSMLGYVVLIFSLANYANRIGLGPSQAALVSAIFNLSQGVGRPLIGYFSDQTGRINMAGFTTFLVSVFILTIWINAKSYGLLLFFAVVCGTVAGTFWTTIGPVIAEVVGLRNVPSGLNLTWLIIALPCLFSEPIALQIIQGTGSYLGAQLFTGLMYLAAAICLVAARGWKIGEVDQIAQILNESPRHIDRVKIENDEELCRAGRKAGRKRILASCHRPGRV
ncbi:Major facilitator superfamily domain, general substrate transporter [Moelleriella libera RCEF 2490]|uniref:Major facilitator superfamily domain, general substrate transporter n=1 Tax=Moelleriella libera RCEF 2490 TaxID=1081109 RepID=A0A166UGH7_9HYPO|nr:Major facilitator superfamily domain, general substrate transporter [Moelleriella libera RCEF 2490]